MLVKDIMTAPALSVEPSTPIAEAARLMLERRISGLPVVNVEGRLVGIVSEGDFLRRAELGTERKRGRWLEFLLSPGVAADEYVRSRGRRVEEVMSPEVLTISRDAPIEEAVRVMTKHRVKRLPVVEGGSLIGIVSRSDLLRALAGALPENGASLSDEQIRTAIMAELAKQSWAGAELIRVSVTDGVVELSGTILDDRARLAAKVAAENVPGVLAVTDQLVWVEPMSGLVIPATEADGTTRS